MSSGSSVCLAVFVLGAARGYRKLLRSFLLGLSGVVGTYVVQFRSAADFGPLGTPLIAAGLPVVVNAVRQWLASFQKPTDPPAPSLDVTGLDQVTPPKSAGLLLAPLLLVPSLAQAEVPKAIINGPTTAVPGELLVLDASPGCAGRTSTSLRYASATRG